MQTKSPIEFGFSIGAEFSVDAQGRLSEVVVHLDARSGTGFVYVAWLTPSNQALKVGFTSNSLWNRWSGIVRVMNAVRGIHNLRSNEWTDKDRLIGPAAGQSVTVWFKPASRTQIPYASAEGFPDVSLAEAEERFLDWYYAPLFGKALGPRRL